MERLEYIIEDSTIAEVLGVQNFSNEGSAVLDKLDPTLDPQCGNDYAWNDPYKRQHFNDFRCQSGFPWKHTLFGHDTTPPA